LRAHQVTPAIAASTASAIFPSQLKIQSALGQQRRFSPHLPRTQAIWLAITSVHSTQKQTTTPETHSIPRWPG